MLSKEEFSAKEVTDGKMSDSSILVRCPHREAAPSLLHPKLWAKTSRMIQEKIDQKRQKQISVGPKHLHDPDEWLEQPGSEATSLSYLKPASRETVRKLGCLHAAEKKEKRKKEQADVLTLIWSLYR